MGDVNAQIEEYYAEQYAPTDYRANPVAHYASNIKGRADWLPDPAVMNFVQEFLTELFPMDIDFLLKTNETWAPITVLSTLEWVKIGGWWLFRYSDIGFSEEQYKSIWKFIEDNSFTEHDPENLIIFLKDPNKNFFQHRWSNAGLTNQEHMDLIPFIEKIGFPQWDKEPPPRGVTEIISWATLLWVLSENGFDWARDVDLIFDYTAEFDRSFLSAKEESNKEELRLLDPRKMNQTNRPVGTCACCGTSQYCVDGYFLMGNVIMQKSEQDSKQIETGWAYMCNHCAAIELKDNQGIRDYDAENPKCGNSKCLNTSCPHLRVEQDNFGNAIPKSLLDAGRNRISEYERFIEQHGASPRQLSGQTLEQIMDHFKHA